MFNMAARAERLLAFVARMIISAIIIFLAILAVDVVALRLLSLPMDVETWVTLLFWEGLVMIAFGVGVWGGGQLKWGPTAGWRSPRTYRIWVRLRYVDFWTSVALAGLLLFILSLYLISQHYPM